MRALEAVVLARLARLAGLAGLGMSGGLAACGATALPMDAQPVTAAVITPVVAGHELGLFPGESMTFEVKLAGVLVGEAELAVGELGVVDGREAVVVRSRAATAGAAAFVKAISDEATSTIDVATGHPLAVSTEVHIDGKKVTSQSTFTGTHAKVSFQRDDGAAHDYEVAFGTSELFDAHAAMAAMRGWNAPTGTVRTVYVVGGRRLWRVDMTYGGGASIGTALGNRRAVVMDGLSYRARRDLTLESDKPTRTFRVWLSDDGDRVPLRLSATTELGDIEMTLLEYQRP